MSDRTNQSTNDQHKFDIPAHTAATDWVAHAAGAITNEAIKIACKSSNEQAERIKERTSIGGEAAHQLNKAARASEQNAKSTSADKHLPGLILDGR